MEPIDRALRKANKAANAFLAAVILFALFIMGVGGVLSYQMGRLDGADYGLQTGLAIADAWERTANQWKATSAGWEKRARKCEGRE